MIHRKHIVFSLLIGMLFTVLLSCNNKANLTSFYSDGTKVNFTKLGSEKPTLVFIHGWGNNRSIWDGQMEFFLEKYQVIAVDLPGYGTSGHNREEWSMSNFGKDIATMLQELELHQVVLVGFSMGAPVAIEASLKDSNPLIGIVLVDQIKDVDMKYSADSREFLETFMMDLIQNPTREKLIGGGFFMKNKEASYKRVVAMLQSDSSRIGWRASIKDVMRWQNEDLRAAIKNVEVPIALINSDKEPTNSEGLLKIVPDITINIVSETGHVIMWDQPIEFNRLLEKNIQMFLKNNKQ